MSKIIQKRLIALFIISTVSGSIAQEQDLNLINLQITLDNQNSISFYDGEVSLKNNETLKGRISLNHSREDQYVVMLRTDEGYRYILNEDVNSVTLFEKSKDKTFETKFVLLEGHNKLLRELYKKDDETAIYDSMEKPFDYRIMSGVYILENKQLNYIYNFWSSGPKKDIINYVNKRDNSKYKRKYFKSLNDLFAKI